MEENRSWDLIATVKVFLGLGSFLFVLLTLPLSFFGEDVFRFMLWTNVGWTLLAATLLAVRFFTGLIELFLPVLTLVLAVAAFLASPEVVGTDLLLAQIAAFFLWLAVALGWIFTKKDPTKPAEH